MSVVQDVDWLAVGPAVAAAVGAVAVLVVDVVLGPARRAVLGWLAAGALAAGAALLLPLMGQRRGTFCFVGAGRAACSYQVDSFTVSFQAVTLLGALVVVLLSVGAVGAQRKDGAEARLPAGEYWFLLLCSVTGALVLSAARDLLTLVVALEVVTLPTYALVGLRRDDPRSSEAAVKFFLVSVTSSALMLYGVALVYGVTGKVTLSGVAAVLGGTRPLPSVVGAGVLLTTAGFAFKVAAVPFHFWAPDTYDGAPAPVAAYLSVVSKAAGFAGLLLVLAVGFPSYVHQWAPAFAVLAALTMTVGNLAALRQRRALRLLAWSSVAQSGYLLVPLGSADVDLRRAVGATTTYVLAYAAMNLLAFGVVVAVGRRQKGLLLADYAGLWRREPLAAAALAFALACLAGLPPGLLGLFAKVVVFDVPVAAGSTWLAVVMAVNVAIGLAYYLSWAALLVRGEPGSRGVAPARRLAVADSVAIGLALGVTVTLSVVPALVVGVLDRGAVFLH